MTLGGYDAFADPYAYKGTNVLKNRAGLRDARLLESFELEMTALRAEEALPAGRFGPAHYRAVHRHLFRDVYSWAGRYRTVRAFSGTSGRRRPALRSLRTWNAAQPPGPVFGQERQWVLMPQFLCGVEGPVRV